MSEIITEFDGLTVIETIEDDLSYFLSDEIVILNTTEND